MKKILLIISVLFLSTNSLASDTPAPVADLQKVAVDNSLNEAQKNQSEISIPVLNQKLEDIDNRELRIESKADAALADVGTILQIVNYQTGAVATGTTAMPQDDTIPQNTEGNEFMSLSITPTSATNKLKIDVVYNVSWATSGTNVQAALFQDSTANALIAQTIAIKDAANPSCGQFTYYMTAGTTSATTFKFRAGGNAGSTVTFNGASGVRLFGGVYYSSITITEIKT